MLKVLYVDDDDDIREVAELSLQMDSMMEVRTASSGDAALSLLRGGAWRPHAVLLDVMMPGVDGPAVLRAMRTSEDFADLPVIFVTARVQKAETDGLLALGAVGIITKPFDPIAFAGRVRALLASA